MIKGFRDFILRGNVIELAVAVVIGGAFTAIVSSIVDGLITPLISIFFSADSVGGWTLDVPTLFGGTATFQIGLIVSGIITFLATALVVYFFMVVPMNKFNERRAAKAAAGIVEEEDVPPTEAELLTEIRDLLRKQNQA